MSLITLRQEKQADFWEEAWPLIQQHWKTLCIDPEKLKLDPDYQRYAKLEELGALYLLVARRDGRMIGYIMVFILPHMHYKTSGEVAMTDMYWTDPKERNGVGLKLFVRFEADMRRRGVTQMMTSCKTSEDHTKFLQLLDWKHTDNTLSKFVGKL